MQSILCQQKVRDLLVSEKETIYYLETADGDLMRVPESKLKEFSEMQKAQKLSAQKKETPTQHSSAKTEK